MKQSETELRQRQDMGALTVFIAIGLAGCTFLLYFLYALWRDERSIKQRHGAELRVLPARGKSRRKLLRLYVANETPEISERKRL